jgi:guanylate kinase
MSHVITITGPSGAGKSTTIRYLLDNADDGFRPKLVPKYTTRPKHLDDQGEVICVNVIPGKCDLVYEQYRERYGLQLSTIFDLVKDQYSPIVILNDIRAVEDVRNCLKGLVRSVFIFRESPSLDKYRAVAKTKGMESQV